MNLQTGKLPKKEDPRNIKLAKIFKKVLPPIPDQWDVDQHLVLAVPNRMLGNDRYGNCVCVTKYNWMLRAEAYEQVTLIPVTERACALQSRKSG